MNQPALKSEEADLDSLDTLRDQYVARHTDLGNYFLYFSIDSWLVRRLGIQPLDSLGRLAGGLVWFLMALLPALILTAVTGQWTDAPLLSWISVAVACGGVRIIAPTMVRPAISSQLSWLWAIVDEPDLRQLIAWERRWYSNWLSVPVSGVLTLAFILLLYVVGFHGSGLHAGTFLVGGFLVFGVMQNQYAAFMMAPEAHQLSRCKYDLYLLSPTDSVVVRKALRGYRQIGVLNVLIFTSWILLVLILVPSGSDVGAPAVLSLLVLQYVTTIVGTLGPRLALGRVIKVTKDSEMEILQARLNDLLPRLEELTEEEYERMQRLREIQDAIRDSSENLLPLGDVARVVGALALSTLTIVGTAFADVYIAQLVKPFLP